MRVFGGQRRVFVIHSSYARRGPQRRERIMAAQKNVIISIRGQQYMPELDDVGSIELVTAGQLFREGDQYVITYSESELTGLEGTATTLLVQPGLVTLLRTGEMSTHMVFEQGRKNLSLYNTAEGALTVGVSARRVHACITENGGDIEMEYSLEIDNAIAGESRISIQVRESPEAFSSPQQQSSFAFEEYLN